MGCNGMIVEVRSLAVIVLLDLLYLDMTGLQSWQRHLCLTKGTARMMHGGGGGSGEGVRVVMIHLFHQRWMMIS